MYSIWICINPPKNRQNTITRYSITEHNLVGEVKEAVERYDLMTAVMLCLGGPEDKNCTGILKLLDVLFSNETEVAAKRQILEDDFDIPMSQTFESEVSLMCNYSKGVEDRGIAKGRAQGRAQGLAQGLAQGRTEGIEINRLESIQNVMNSLAWTAEQAMDLLKVPVEDRERYLKMLNER